MLIPLKQFYCDECGQVIESLNDGYVEWESGVNKEGRHFARGFRIVHHAKSSPFRQKSKEGCYKYGKSLYRSDIHLEDFLTTAKQELFSYLDLGFLHDPDGSIGCQISDFKEFSDFFRRLTIPYYEEARVYFDQVLYDGCFCDNNEIAIYTEDTLRQIIEKFTADK